VRGPVAIAVRPAWDLEAEEAAAVAVAAVDGADKLTRLRKENHVEH